MRSESVVLIFILLIFIGFSGCTAIFTGLYGMKKVKKMDNQTISEYMKRYEIPVADGYVLDTSYFSFLKSFDGKRYANQIKNHYQPLQALYYNQSGELTSFQVNCYAGGFPNLKWNRNEIMATFPPKKQAPLDSLVSLETQLKFLKPMAQTLEFQRTQFDYIVVVYWSRFMGRQSKRLIQYIHENSRLTTQKVKILYANNDDFFVGK